jgi:replicative DNA helicase
MLTTIADENHLNCPIVVGAQINRAGRKKVSKPPTKSDIKGCGNIEEDADAVILSWYEAVDNVNALYKDKVALIVDKNKITGRLGRVDTRIDKVTTRLFDWPANPQRFNQHVDYTDTDYRQGDSTGNLH